MHPRDAEYLALSNGKIDPVDLFAATIAAHSKPLDLENGFSGFGLALEAIEQYLSADHHPRQILFGGFGGVDGTDGLAVAEDGDVLGDRQRLVEFVRDENERVTVGPEVVHDVHQALDLLGRKHRRRFVENEHFRAR